MNRYRKHHMHIVAFAPEYGMRRHVRRDVHVARGTSTNAGVASSLNPNAIAVADPRRDAHLHCFAARLLTQAAARLARLRSLPARAAASWAAA